MKINQLIQITAFGVVFLLLGLILMRKPKQVFQHGSNKVITNNIDNSHDTIIELNNGILKEKAIIQAMDKQLKVLFNELEQIKARRDTFEIIQQQDTIISFLVRQGASKDSVILLQEGVIKQYEFISKSKDTLIAVKDFDLKRIKRQRNLSFVANGVLTGILIFK